MLSECEKKLEIFNPISSLDCRLLLKIVSLTTSNKCCDVSSFISSISFRDCELVLLWIDGSGHRRSLNVQLKMVHWLEVKSLLSMPTKWGEKSKPKLLRSLLGLQHIVTRNHLRYFNSLRGLKHVKNVLSANRSLNIASSSASSRKRSVCWETNL